VAEFDTEAPSTVKVAEDALTKFLTSCVTKYGQEPPVWAKRCGESTFSDFDPSKESVGVAEEIIIHPPLVKG
jgi:hypothetical protein